MPDINIQYNDKQLTSKLRRLAFKVDNLRPVFKTIGNIVRTSVIQNFKEQGRPEKWPDISPMTKLARLKSRRKSTKSIFLKAGGLRKSSIKSFGNMKILIDSGRLMKSIHATPKDDQVTIGPNNLEYAAIQQFGGFASFGGKRVKIPARPYLIVQKEDKIEMIKALVRHMEKS